MTRREAIEAVLFLPAIAALAAFVFALLAGVIHAAWWVFEALTVLLDPLLPRPVTFAVTVLALAALVAGLGSLLAYGPRRRRGVHPL